ncbi:MAG: methyl-accepting chemotaxis protein [Pseudomonadota bacterium]
MSAAGASLQSRESNTLVSALGIVLALVFGGIILNFYLLNQAAEQQRRHLGLITETQVLSQQIAKFANEAAGGNFDAFEELGQSKLRIDSNLGALTNGDPDTGLSELPSAVENERYQLDNDTWQPIRAEVDKILARDTLVVDLAETADNFAADIPLLQARLSEVSQVLASIGARPQQIYWASSTPAVAERMLRRVNEILQGGYAAVSAADSFGRDAVLLRDVLNGLLNGDENLGIEPLQNPEALELLGGVFEVYSDVEANVEQILSASTDLLEVKDASDNIFLDSEQLLTDAQTLEEAYNALADGERLFPSVAAGVAMGAGALLIIVVLLWLLYRDQRARFKVTEELNQRNQEAILRLLDEMGSLAEGDLTVKATVTEDITGAIADSINFAIEALRSLVTTINETAVQVASAAQETQATAMHLAEASEHQAQQITSASAAINEIAVSIDEVSKNSAESADVAQRSVAIAAKGAEVVRQTIEGMDNIRDQIQETSKRIKRLGESSQEIGDIVELINDIAEQTNILALNAAIQAASAGEAGRGFAVVADEVQRLAERASKATKRIETLVQTIQADTNEAVISMEQTTTEVVNGARLAEDAGEALGEIEKVSHDLADLLQSISEAARQQSAAATNISGTMNVIQEITTQTSAGTSQTAESIGHLADLAAELRRSVADFKLPA